jgi:hypothetical protein
VKAICVAREPDIVQGYSRWGGCCGDHINPVSRVISDNSFSYVQGQAIVVGRGDAIARKPEYHAVFDIHGLCLENVYSLNAVAEAVNRNPTECDHVCTSGVNDHAGGEGSENRSKRPGTIEGDRFGDGDRTKATWIQSIDLTAGGGF